MLNKQHLYENPRKKADVLLALTRQGCNYFSHHFESQLVTRSLPALNQSSPNFPIPGT